MEKEKFEELVGRAIESLPDEFKARLENVDIIIEDYASNTQLRKLKLNHPLQLLGLYEGIPRTKRGTNYTFALPDKITIFQKPIEARCKTDKQVEIEIGNVVRHEIAHHFGISDQRMRQLRKDKNVKSKDVQ